MLPEKKTLLKLFRKRKTRIITICLGIVVLGVIGFMFFYYLLINKLTLATNALAQSNYSEIDKTNWTKSVADFPFFNSPTPSTDNNNNDFYQALQLYTNSFADFNAHNLMHLPAVIIKNQKQTEVTFGSLINPDDPKVPAGISYNLLQQGIIIKKYLNCNIEIADTTSPQLQIYLSTTDNANSIVNVKGTASNQIVLTESNKVLTIIKTAILNRDSATLAETLAGTDNSQLTSFLTTTINQDKLNSLRFFSNLSGTSDTKIVNNLLKLGELKTTADGKNNLGTVKLYYDITSHNYRFDGLLPIIQQAKVAGISINSEIVLTCSDCWLAPVDKTYALKSSYIPKVVNTGLAGGGQMLPEAAAALKKLFAGASASGINIKIVSAYRSYNTQVGTFNYWVQQQKKTNPKLTQQQAETQANTVSARAGHSEHQLGTVVDLKCSNCSEFDNSTKNLALYTFLKEHAFEYGFAISYPENTTQYTGYQYEPWHVRYIGLDLASEFYNTKYLSGNGNFLAKFLLEKHLY